MIRDANRGYCVQRECYQCGKKFETMGTDWAYAYPNYHDVRRKYFCSWHCLRDFKRKKGLLTDGDQN